MKQKIHIYAIGQEFPSNVEVKRFFFSRVLTTSFSIEEALYKLFMTTNKFLISVACNRDYYRFYHSC